MDRLQETAMMKEVEQYSKEHPEWMKEAHRVLTLWGDGQHLLTVAIARALQQAYENGKAGKGPSAQIEPPRVTRTRPKAPSEGTTKRTTRTRR